MKKSLIALTAIGSMIATTPAFAGEAQIKYNDLNLASAEGQQTLERRIDKAAREVCGVSRQRTGTRIPSGRAQQCYQDAKKQAALQVASLIGEQRLGG
ncbi:MAG: UrcA family protein [Pontixanthobacter sp.]